jgi:hypothetical protein
MKKLFLELINGLSEKVGVKLEVEDNETITRVMVDIDPFALIIEYIRDSEQVLIAAPVGAAPEQNAEAFYRELLQAQYLFHKTGGTTLSLDPAAQAVCLQAARDMQALTPQTFPTLIENFLHVAEVWREKCETAATATTTATATTATGGDPARETTDTGLPGLPGGMIRV